MFIHLQCDNSNVALSSLVLNVALLREVLNPILFDFFCHFDTTHISLYLNLAPAINLRGSSADRCRFMYWDHFTLHGKVFQLDSLQTTVFTGNLFCQTSSVRSVDYPLQTIVYCGRQLKDNNAVVEWTAVTPVSPTKTEIFEWARQKQKWECKKKEMGKLPQVILFCLGKRFCKQMCWLLKKCC